MSDKINRLREFIKRQPDSPFPRYGLAMEYKKHSDWVRAIEVFRGLLDIDPDYLAAYLQYGMSLQSNGEIEEAAIAFRSGLEVAYRKGDSRAEAELKAALEELES